MDQTEAGYNQQRELMRLESLQKSLNDLHSELVKHSVRCHMLQVDLATQFSPTTVQAASAAVEDCARCCARLGSLTPTEAIKVMTFENID